MINVRTIFQPLKYLSQLTFLTHPVDRESGFYELKKIKFMNFTEFQKMHMEFCFKIQYLFFG